jgi:hypothetical protein
MWGWCSDSDEEMDTGSRWGNRQSAAIYIVSWGGILVGIGGIAGVLCRCAFRARWSVADSLVGGEATRSGAFDLPARCLILILTWWFEHATGGMRGGFGSGEIRSCSQDCVAAESL